MNINNIIAQLQMNSEDNRKRLVGVIKFLVNELGGHVVLDEEKLKAIDETNILDIDVVSPLVSNIFLVESDEAPSSGKFTVVDVTGSALADQVIESQDENLQN